MLENKVAVVTGASRGIGRAIVLMLAREGCHVAFNYQKSRAEAAALEKEAAALSVKCRASQVDIKDFAAVKAWVEEVKKEFGRLDILVNNAGIIIDKALVMMEEKDWREVIDTNLNGCFNASRACIYTFLRQKSGDIVNISSVSGVVGLPRQTNYSASKGGINAFTKALAKETAGYGVRVNAVAPGFIETEILAGFTSEQKEKIIKDIPLGRIGSVEDVAACVRFLLGPQSRYITGQVIQVDGGLAVR
ncbi:MAG: 3-oxoacyl-ACP reductase family protein [Candidatus Omnitrophota bacterium]|nr:3-oxoacyl-ACP reductase family protein [Candidatus Omnitrophota bacterium]